MPRMGCTSPAMVRSVVVLPAPFGPSRATNSPSSTLQVDAPQDLEEVVSRFEVGELEHASSVPSEDVVVAEVGLAYALVLRDGRASVRGR